MQKLVATRHAQHRKPPDRAVILFAHGARDACWSRSLGELAVAVRRRLPEAVVTVAFLEFQPPTLAEALQDAVGSGCTTIDVVPVFWARGGHVADDLPPLMAALREAHPRITLTLLPVLSELPDMLDFISGAIERLTQRA